MHVQCVHAINRDIARCHLQYRGGALGPAQGKRSGKIPSTAVC